MPYDFFKIWVDDTKKSICPKCFKPFRPQNASVHMKACKGDHENFFDKFKKSLLSSIPDLKFNKDQIKDFTDNFKLKFANDQDDDDPDPGDDDMTKDKKKKGKDKDNDDDGSEGEEPTPGADPSEWKKSIDDLKDEAKKDRDETKKDQESFMESIKKILTPKDDESGSGDDEKDKKKKGSESDETSAFEDMDKKDIAVIITIIIIIIAMILGYIGMEINDSAKTKKKESDKKKTG